MTSKCTFLQTVSGWVHDSAKPFNKLTIKGSEPVKVSHITDVLGVGPFLHGSDIFKIRRDTISIDYKS